MKKIIFYLSAIVWAALVGCTKDAPSPNDETKNDSHEAPSKITVIIKEGHLHGTDFHANPESQFFKTSQQITFAYNAEGNLTPDSSSPVLLMQGKDYSLEILYYNQEGKQMNGEFVTPEMAKVHQHFFISKNIKSLSGTAITKSDNISYTYRDTDPWNVMYSPINRNAKRVSLRNPNDPIGLKGYFKVNDSHQTFDLNVILVHVIAGSKLDDNGKPYPFNAPSERLSTEISFHIPMKIYTAYPKNDSEFPKFISDIANEFGVSEQEAKNQFDNLKKGEENDYYM